MGSSNDFDFENLCLLLEHDNSRFRNTEIEPTPYVFKKLENGKKTVIDSTSLVPPSWLLLDHTIAVVWLMFSANSSQPQLNINDLKWAHEFLKEVRNNRGENPPDVKACLKQIQDRLIELYAKLTNLKDDDYVEELNTIAESIYNESRSLSLSPRRVDSRQLDKVSDSSSLFPSRTTIQMDYPLHQKQSSKDLAVAAPKSKKSNVAQSKNVGSLVHESSNIFDESMNGDDEVEKYFMKLLHDDLEDEILQTKSSTKSLTPGRRNVAPVASISEISCRDSLDAAKDKTPKRVHYLAEMRSVQYQKSKVQDPNGEEAAFSNLKAEVRQLVINPKITNTDIKKILNEMKKVQVDKLHSELNRLNSIQEMIKNIDDDQPNLEIAQHNLNEIDTPMQSAHSFGLHSDLHL